MTDKASRAFDRRIMRSRRALAKWKREDTEMSKAQTIAELNVLSLILEEAPVEKRDKIKTLMLQYAQK